MSARGEEIRKLARQYLREVEQKHEIRRRMGGASGSSLHRESSGSKIVLGQISREEAERLLVKRAHR